MQVVITPATLARFKKAAHKAEMYNGDYLTFLIRQELESLIPYRAKSTDFDPEKTKFSILVIN